MEDGLTHFLKADEASQNEIIRNSTDLIKIKQKQFMKALILGFFLLLGAVQSSSAQSTPDSTSKRKYTKAEQEIINLSKTKWQWMADKNVEKLAPLFIKTGSIWYRKTDVHDVAVEIVNDVAIAWSRITLTAEVRGTDAVTQFTVTEVYKKQGNDWKLLVLTFSSVRDTHQIKH
jgi:hypothetical protein